MTTETEAKFLNQNHGNIRLLLKRAGADLVHPMTDMKRVLFDKADGSLDKLNAFIRLRDEGIKISLTYKQFNELSVDGAKEIETTVGDFDETLGILSKAGLIRKSYQESRREKWMLDGVEVVLDQWPWVPEFIEVEGQDVDSLKVVASKLGLDWSDASFGDATVAYLDKYPGMDDSLKRDIGVVGDIRFNDPVPSLLN